MLGSTSGSRPAALTASESRLFGALHRGMMR